MFFAGISLSNMIYLYHSTNTQYYEPRDFLPRPYIGYSQTV